MRASKRIVFIDTEVNIKSKRIQDVGAVDNDGRQFHAASLPDFSSFLDGTSYLAGHNIIRHDIPCLKKSYPFDFSEIEVFDTLYWSPLLFPNRPYHALLKDDKLESEELNNPQNDAQKAQVLFWDEVSAFNALGAELKSIYYLLLQPKKEFSAFFSFVDYSVEYEDVVVLIQDYFAGELCAHAPLEQLAQNKGIELAYCLALINAKERYSITPPWVIKNYPEVESVMHILRSKACVTGCIWCDRAMDATLGLKKFFGFDAYRKYDGQNLQQDAVQAALDNKSLLAIFPTGGGKSITFQIPALMSGENVKGLTVVISPLQSLMKDQVDNLEKNSITEGVTINGLLDPIERSKSIERIENGDASILYISPESLRSRTIERLLLGRNIVRFVIDEAHCFSAWGQDFRVDYLYIGDFIKSLQEKKNLEFPIPVSCFTATAKQKVIQDIKDYFSDKLSLELETFSAKATRTNLQYKVLPKDTDEEKYLAVRQLYDAKPCPTIVYVSRTRRAYQIAERLVKDGYCARPYHGKMDKQEKSENQDAFIRGDVAIMVATSAFGMGVDKKDVGTVIHFEISDSLENYVQEAGRAGRDENITADCYVLFNEEDLSKHFILLNQTKLHIKEIQQVWKSIKELTRFRSTASNSALEIARKAGWDDNVADIETRVTTAIAALEEAQYIKRGQNMPRIFANSILSANAQEAIEKINASGRFNEQQKQQGTRIIKKLFSNKSRKESSDEIAESRIDHISDHLGIVKEEVINVVNLLREEKILADNKDLRAYIRKDEKMNKSLKVLEAMAKIERFLLSQWTEEEQTFHTKDLNEKAENSACNEVSPQRLKTLINFWTIKNWITKKPLDYSKSHLSIRLCQDAQVLEEKLAIRHQLSAFILELLYQKTLSDTAVLDPAKELTLVDFSVQELKEEYEGAQQLFGAKISLADVEDALFYLSRIGAMKIEGGFLVVYNKLNIERLEKNNLKRYSQDDYKSLKQFYESKTQQIHIVGEYAKKMISDYREALQFVEDYFQLNYSSFLRKYFNAEEQEKIKRNITPAKFKQLFGDLSPAQLGIIKDKDSPYIAVAAGPGSGKTRVLVHKLASLLLMEDVKHEQLLMVTFSRAAAAEFKKRLHQLIGNAAAFIEIKTFHSYCFDLLGKVGTLEKSERVIPETVEKIRSKDIEANRITKTVLVIDEAQDMDADEFELIKALMAHNEEMRVIAVGDDDQNIYEFRGASSKHLEDFIFSYQAIKYELIENYRSKANIVAFANRFAEKISHRLKVNPTVANTQEEGLVSLTRHNPGSLIVPVVNQVLNSDLAGSTCVLTHTNEEALQVNGWLNSKGCVARLIQSNDSFNLYNMMELRYFIDQLGLREDSYTITPEMWQQAKRQLWDRYKKSTQMDTCIQVVKAFENSYPVKKYKSDFLLFIRESKLEDFAGNDRDIVYVSTIHKAKGKEFDNVFLMLDNYTLDNDARKRELYVAITRAKHALSIHTNNAVLDDIKLPQLIKKQDDHVYDDTHLIILQLKHSDVWLSYLAQKQYAISQLQSGDSLGIISDGCLDAKRHYILRFSKSFNEKMATYTAKGYHISKATINHILYWKPENSEKEIRIILPELVLEKGERMV